MRTARSGTPPLTTQDQLLHIRALGQRIAGHVEFMCGVGILQGPSPESKQKAVAVFYDRLKTLERELSGIQENLRLG
jgi:hypothetical protein